MSCPYQFYEDESSYYPMLYCRVQSKPCLYRKRCDLQQKYISIDGADDCYILMEAKRKEIPNGSYFVKAKQVLPNGCYRLYVELNGNVVQYVTKTKEFNQDYVYIGENGECSTIPVKKETKTVKPKTSKKKTDKSNE